MSGIMQIEEICRRLPHRYPMLLVDRVLELEAGSHIHAYKNISYNEQLFQGHFPNSPVFPGVLVIEALAQISALLGFESLGVVVDDNLACYLTGADNFKFRKPVVPGDALHLHAKLTKHRSNIGFFETYATVENAKCCSGQITCLYRIEK